MSQYLTFCSHRMPLAASTYTSSR